ncbi:hypothetical protein [Oceanicoccus sp. KOV_DT_Chl]|uniref:hypothetical protein n=1 Tax=Oceanicoccus sp. KOV_DT_Chl TaxID=1904639 RepID=UPI000C7B788E|nr:hypothetical protein [Oceanicoccus sp. KOV_DT_Chl]
MIRLLSLCALLVVASGVQASVFGKHVRAAGVDEKFPEQITISRFSTAMVNDMACEWEGAGSLELRTDRGNVDLSNFGFSPSVVKVSCEGKKPFYVVAVDPNYLGANAAEGDIGLWFGEVKDRYGCEGYHGCDKVHVLHTYRAPENIVPVTSNGSLQSW